MGAIIHTATPGDIKKLIPLLDEEFVFSKGRKISFAQRFPAIYCQENMNNIFIAEENGLIISALAVKQFNWLDNGDSFRGAMIGATYTHPQRRKQGWASRLLAWVADNLKRDKVDFAVLWASAPAFYARLGWVANDCGLLGEIITPESIAGSPDEVEVMPANSAHTQSIELIRQQWLNTSVSRHATDYRKLPPPAETVSLLSHSESAGSPAYALVGYKDDTNIVYEIVGPPDSFHALWRNICSPLKLTIVNDQPDSASYRWLTQNTSVMWQTKPLAMWLPLSAKADIERISAWYIPYFDRI